jgi:DNA-directed RNA polymerase sigma subunit (sigma70/sigma32)
MTDAGDSELWDAYEAATAAGDQDALRLAAEDIIARHMPFFVQYAQQTAFRQWDSGTRDDYLAEILAVAYARISTYNRNGRYREGRTAKFVTYVKPYLKPLRYSVEGNTRPMRICHATVRMSAAVSRYIAAEHALGNPTPTYEEIAEHIQKLFGKSISPARVHRLLQLPRGVPFTQPSDDGDEYVNPQVSERADAAVDDPAEIVTEQLHREWKVKQVRDVLSKLTLTGLEQAILVGRLSAEQPASLMELAVKFGVTEMEVEETERALVLLLSQLLG